MKVKNYKFLSQKVLLFQSFVHTFVVLLFFLPKLGPKYCLKMEKEAQSHLRTMKTDKGFCKSLSSIHLKSNEQNFVTVLSLYLLT